MAGRLQDAAAAWAYHSVLRKDRNRFGGGIISYVSDSLHPSVLSCNDIPSLEYCQSDIRSSPSTAQPTVCRQLPSVWKIQARHDEAVSCIMDITDYAFTSHLECTCTKVVIAGDFNDLRFSYDDIARATCT